MSLIRPAPLWRRFAASIYDGLLLFGLWAAVVWVDLLVRESLNLPRNAGGLQVLEFIVGLGFFGRSWTRGGQTLGMRVWQLQVRRHDGSALRWPVAGLRYTVMLFTWIAALLPAILLIPKVAAQVHADTAILVGLAYSTAALLLIMLDPTRRAPCDLVARTEVVVIPKA